MNPNGVDPERYSPAVDGSAVRRRHGLEGRRVVGFIGSFGRWHGAEVLADAFGRLLARRPRVAGLRPAADDRRRRHDAARAREPRAPRRRRARLCSPAPCRRTRAPRTSPPATSSPRPTCATRTARRSSARRRSCSSTWRWAAASWPPTSTRSGRCCATTGRRWLVEPGDADALAAGLERLLDEPSLAARLGAAARSEAVARHTWRDHTRRIVEALVERCARGAVDPAPGVGEGTSP